ncbi:MAG: glycoside hydrolase family 3 C-terminal domain-containing protein [Myxococcota bacterium]|nr:glycoside hydrolase family 3 C-terminal domain-containing protein [Myxococcota bacterium]
MSADSPDIEAEAKQLLASLSLDEKLHLMSGDERPSIGLPRMARAYNARPIPAGAVPERGIPGIQFTDGPRGVVMFNSTAFPAAIARGASWDLELEERIGDAIGVEARAQGANLFAGVCINLLRHPAWGRAQETYGEEPYALGEFGAAMVRGVQRHTMACVKHFAANSIENSRFRVDVRMSDRTLHEVYLPHFRRCIDEGAASVMSAYNRLNGSFCGHHPELLREILKQRWGFDGFVMSDFVFGVRGPGAAACGLDLEMPFKIHFGRRLERALRRGRVSEADIDDAALRLLRQQLRFARVGEPERYDESVVAGAEHRALARESARKSIVLLRNETLPGEDRPVLPIDPQSTNRIALIGGLATKPNLGDLGSSQVRPPEVITILGGLEGAGAGHFEVVYDTGKDPEAAVDRAASADVAIVVAGYGPRDEGEYIGWAGGDRANLTLRDEDERLIEAVAARNPRTVVVMIGGSAIVTEAWRESVAGVLMAWYPGMEGGAALAEILLGRANPSGRLPCVFPRSADQLPFFDAKAKSIEYGFLHGQRWLDANGSEPAYPLGFGLGYSAFAYEGLELDRESVASDGSIKATIRVTNSGEVTGDEVVQLYVGCRGSRVERAERVLAGFQRITLEPNESRAVEFDLDASSLAFYDEKVSDWEVEPTTYSVEIGPCADPDRLLSATFRVV